MPVKIKLKILQNFVAFSEYKNFIQLRRSKVAILKWQIPLADSAEAISEYIKDYLEELATWFRSRPQVRY